MMKNSLTIVRFHSKIIVENGETTNVVRLYNVLTHLTREGLQMCLFFYWFVLLPNINVKIISKATVMIVIPIKP